MDIDERIEKLTERHEALTQSVELMVTENKNQVRRIERIMTISSDLARDVVSLSSRVGRIEYVLDTVVGAVNDFTHETARLFRETNEQIQRLAENQLALVEAQKATDKRWSELIDQLNREHGNGHGEQQ